MEERRSTSALGKEERKNTSRSRGREVFLNRGGEERREAERGSDK
jgi:hypothetical protein